ncbi:MAG: hypothetical protein ACTSQ6_07455 [Candidatus Heimdallarchaeaceae archaeon]
MDEFLLYVSHRATPYLVEPINLLGLCGIDISYHIIKLNQVIKNLPIVLIIKLSYASTEKK